MSRLYKVISSNSTFLLPLIILLINLIYFNRFFPPTEGWWHTYGYLINMGLEPYKDFYSAIAPLFMYFNALLLKILGENFFLFRLFGILCFLLNIFLLQWLLARITNNTKIASLGVFIASALYMSDIVYMPYDYINYLNTLLILALILLFYLLEKKRILYNMIISFLLGINSSAIIFMKQNVGIFLLFSIVMFILFFVKNKIYYLVSFIIGFITFIYVLSFFLDIELVVKSIFISNDAKGSPFTVLFRFLLDENTFGILAVSVILVFFYIFGKKLLFLVNEIKISNGWLSNTVNKILPKILLKTSLNSIQKAIFLISVLLFIFINLSNVFYNLFIKSMLVTIISILIYKIYLFYKFYPIKMYHFNKKNEYIYFSFLPVLGALTYCTTHTSSFNFLGLYVVAAFLLSYFLEKIKELKLLKYIYIPIIIVMIGVMVNKFIKPYEWWGLDQNSIFSAKYKTNYEQLNGLFVDEKTKELFNVISYYINQYSRENDDIFMYPHIPIFYLLHHKIPPTKSPIMWFDFVTTKQLRDDLELLKVKKPRLIIILQPPLYVYKGHYQLLDHYLYQEEFDILFTELLLSGEYRLEHVSIYKDKISQYKIYKRELIAVNDFPRRIKNMPTYIFKVNTQYRNGVIKKEISEIKKGDLLFVEIKGSFLHKVYKEIGLPFYDNDFYILKILIRND